MRPPEPLPPARERFLRYWSANMALAWGQSNGAPWVGFGYDPAETARMKVLAGGLPFAAGALFFGVTVVVFIAFAAAGIAGLLVPLMDWLYPDPSQTKALPFVLTLACVAALSFGIGLPLALAAGGWAGDAWGGGRPAQGAPGDAALAAKIRFQLARMSTIMVGAFVPGCMAFILFDIQAGRVVTVLKIACALASIGSVAAAWRGRAAR